jgi:hypothetical protein
MEKKPWKFHLTRYQMFNHEGVSQQLFFDENDAALNNYSYHRKTTAAGFYKKHEAGIFFCKLFCFFAVPPPVRPRKTAT